VVALAKSRAIECGLVAGVMGRLAGLSYCEFVEADGC